MTDTLSLLSPAKLNLFLHITGRRENGYHELQTLFQLLNWGDQLSFTPDRSGQITLESDAMDIPLEENLVVRAARLLQRGSLGAHIALQKRIPTGAGLGGSIIALGPLSAADDIIRALDERFYAGRVVVVDERVRFVAVPGPGVRVGSPGLDA